MNPVSRYFPSLLLMALVSATLSLRAAETNSVDWQRARQLYQKSQAGQSLTADEQAYLERAKAERRKQSATTAEPESSDIQKARQLLQKQRNGETLTDSEKAFLHEVRKKMGQGRAGAAAPPPARDSIGLAPLDELTSKYKGQDGGLYGAGRNQPPPAQLKLALAESRKVTPLDAEGKRSPDGKIVLLSIGMSNTTQEFSKFKQLADADSGKSSRVLVVDGAQGGQDAELWSRADARAWQVLRERLRAAGVTSNQVQVVWMKHARIAPSRFGDFPAHKDELKGHMLNSIHLAKAMFPNLRLVYLSSRIYAGYAVTGLNPEPYAYEGAFAVRDLILEQVAGEPGLNCDASKGPVKAPVLLWGPYLWCDGKSARKSDGLVWAREDCAGDGTHPSDSGRRKVAELLLKFLKSDPTAAPWFIKGER